MIMGIHKTPYGFYFKDPAGVWNYWNDLYQVVAGRIEGAAQDAVPHRPLDAKGIVWIWAEDIPCPCYPGDSSSMVVDRWHAMKLAVDQTKPK
jgi:hypothetical protein